MLSQISYKFSGTFYLPVYKYKTVNFSFFKLETPLCCVVNLNESKWKRTVK